jgi:outer membrane protein assembly factor BamB
MSTLFLLAALTLGQMNTALPNAALQGTEWPGYKGNGGLTGVSTDTSIRPPFKLLWTYRLDGDFSSDAGAGVTVADGKLFANIHNTRSILAIDAQTGRFAWEYKDSPVGYKTVPTYADGRLLLLERQHRTAAVIALDAASGKLLWKQPLQQTGIDPRRAGLPVVDGRVFCSEGGDEPAVTALDAKTGELVWRTALNVEDGSCAISPVAAGGKVFTATRSAHSGKSTAGATVALDAVSGKILWRRKEVYPSGSLTSDGCVVACGMHLSGDDKFHLLDAETGDTLWTAPRRFHYSPATLTSDLVLIKPYGSNFIAVDRQTGKQQWEFVSKCTSGCCSPVVAGNFAFMGTGVISPGDLESTRAFQHGHNRESPREKGVSGTLHAIDLATGKSVWHFGTGNTICGEPALAYGRLYFASRDGCIYCFAPAKDGEPTTPEAKDTSPAVRPEEVSALIEPRRADQPTPGKDWPMLGGGPDRAGLPLASLKLPLEKAWSVDTGGRVVGAAAIRGGKAFVGSDSGKFLAIDLKTGQSSWQFDAGAGIRCSPAATLDLVYCGADDGRFHAFDTRSGEKRWTFAAGGPVRGSPVIAGGIVLFGANDHNLYALDRHTGKKLWSFRADDYCVQVPPVVHGDQVFCAQWTERIFALDLKTGREQWRSYVPVSVEALSYYRDRLWVRNVHYLVELDPATGQRLRLGNASWGWGGMAFQHNKLFVSGIQSQYGTAGGTVTDLDDPGEEITNTPTLEGVRRLKSKGLLGCPRLAAMGTPLVIGDQICFAAVSGDVYLTDPDGKVRWTHKLGGTCHATPVAADGCLLVGCDDGRLYAFREQSPD